MLFVQSFVAIYKARVQGPAVSLVIAAIVDLDLEIGWCVIKACNLDSSNFQTLKAYLAQADHWEHQPPAADWGPGLLRFGPEAQPLNLSSYRIGSSHAWPAEEANLI